MTDSTTAYGPFGRAARIYRAAGWLSPIPLGNRAGAKSPPPTGYTGWSGVVPSGADIEAWIETHGDRNIGLHVPEGVYVLDVDQYGDKHGAENLEVLAARLGTPLPATWTSTARPGESRHHFFRATLPEGRMWRDHPVPDTESLHRGHRYAVVWPSTNPDAAGAPYVWYNPEGVSGDRPAPSDLTELPAVWIEALSQEGVVVDGTAAGSAETRTVLARWATDPNPDKWCGPVRDWWRQEFSRLRMVAAGNGGNVRDSGRVLDLVARGMSGHLGVPHAIAYHQDLYVKVRSELRGVPASEVVADHWRQVRGAVGKLAGQERASCLCNERTPPATMLDMAVPPLPPSPTEVAALAAVGWLDGVIEQIEALDRAERDDAVRAVALGAVTSGLPEVELQRARATLTTRSGMSGVTLGEFDSIVRDARKQLKEQTKALAEESARAAARDAVAAKRSEGVLLPPPHAPIDVARELAENLPAPAKWWRGDYYLWDGTRYRPWRDEAVDHWLYQRTADAFFEGSDDKGPAPWRPTESKITGVGHALSRGVLYHPSEIDPDDSPSQVACSNGVYDVATNELLPHTPERFNLTSVPFAYDPAATAPTWEWFLNDVLPADAQLFLQEWFGYVLSGRTDLEKIANLVGRRRSGKGTISTTLDALVGAENCAAPSLPSLVGTFGEQPLIGKTLATFSDINWAYRDSAEAVEIIKKISGNDARDVNRKNREVWHGKLAVRFMIMGNDMPRFTDASGALAGRMIHVQFPGSFYGHERPNVKTDLLSELPGILNWALEGLRRLTANGTFTVPQTSEDLADEVRRQQSPVQGFIDDLCAVSENGHPVPLDELFPVYDAWARRGGVEHRLDRERFSRALASAGFRIERKMIDGVRARRVHGLVPAHVSAWTALLNPIGTFPPLSG